jgi:dCMP deaminase
MDTRPDWDTYFLSVCEAIAARADCTRAQIGALIVDANHWIVSTGYNGAPSGAPGCLTSGACPRGRKSLAELPPGGPYSSDDELYCIAVHAEANALLRAGRAATGATLYSTREPCHACTKLAEGIGIARVVTKGSGW